MGYNEWEDGKRGEFRHMKGDGEHEWPIQRHRPRGRDAILTASPPKRPVNPPARRRNVMLFFTAFENMVVYLSSSRVLPNPITMVTGTHGESW
ncbi:hypothetical protein SUGI_1145470 [Cryptomeria japonica]|nr:hypothetical protein SUGI_1145470 [Cryptomeria japonica]